MGCGCSRVAKSQKEIIEDNKKQRLRVEDELKKLTLEKEKVPLPGEIVRKPEEIDEAIKKQHKYLTALKEMEMELDKHEYNELDQLVDYLEVLYTLPTADCYDELTLQVAKIKEFLKANINHKPMTKAELQSMIDKDINDYNEEVKKAGIDFGRSEHQWAKEFYREICYLADVVKKEEINNLGELRILYEDFKKERESKKIDNITASFKIILNFLEKNKKSNTGINGENKTK